VHFDNNMRVASMPFKSGIEMSITTICGRSDCASSIASKPFAASPHTSMPAFSSTARRPSRIILWSSAISTFM
jgi:hypothetical protein